jgi:hypothetical protein
VLVWRRASAGNARYDDRERCHASRRRIPPTSNRFQLDALLAEIARPEALMRADDVNGVLGPHQAFAEDGENDIVVVHNRAEQQQPQPVELEFETRKRTAMYAM